MLILCYVVAMTSHGLQVGTGWTANFADQTDPSTSRRFFSGIRAYRARIIYYIQYGFNQGLVRVGTWENDLGVHMVVAAWLI